MSFSLALSQVGAGFHCAVGEGLESLVRWIWKRDENPVTHKAICLVDVIDGAHGNPHTFLNS